MTDNPCNCATCTLKYPVLTPKWANDTPLRLGERCKITNKICPYEQTSEIGCLSHPRAREYLMRDVIALIKGERK